MPAPMSLSEVIRLPDQSWVNDGLTASVVSIERKTSNKTKRDFWVCQLACLLDPATTVELAIFTAPKFREGDTIELSGKGIKFEDGQYGAKVSMSKTTEVRVVNLSPASRAPTATRPAAPAGGRDDSRGGNAPQEPTNDTGPCGRIQGQTVGMALKEALVLLSKDQPNAALKAQLTSPTFWSAVHEVASDIIRVSRVLEAGHLAKPVKERADQESYVQY